MNLSGYAPEHSAPVRHLLQHFDRLHRHLDWQDAERWLQGTAVMACLGWREQRLEAGKSVSPPQRGASWLRLVALGGGLSVGPAVRRLWAWLLPRMRERGVQRVNVLLMSAWLGRALSSLDFVHVDDVVTLRYTGGPRRALPAPQMDDLMMRPVQTDADLAAVLAVDHAAFEPVWWLSEQDLRAAWPEAASFTLATVEGSAVGYELSVPHGDGVHLARLATIPQMQGQGVGSTLLQRMLRYFQQQGVYTVTVNTQGSNIVSQHLYRRFGFQDTGFGLPIWEARL